MGQPNNYNHPGLDWVVQKFGGTSIGKYAFQIARDIIRESLRRNRVAVVCSARSTTSKAAGTTTRLIEIFNNFDAARRGGARQTDSLASLRNSLQVIVEEHIVAAVPLLQNTASWSVLAARLKTEAQNTVSAVEKAQSSPEYDYSWVQDLLVSLGEKLSCLSMVAILQDLGVEAEYLDLSTILPPSSTPTTDAYYTDLSVAIGARLSACGPRVPVATGFFGYSSGGGMLASAVGRGYTDLCAALCAVGLAAAELQVWKEVDGILTADPSRVPAARLVPRMSLPEATALARGGAEVVHALAVRQIAEAPTAIALCVRNVKRPAAPGTVVLRTDAGGKTEASSSNDSDTDASSLKSGVAFCRAITVKNDVCVLHTQREAISCFPRRASSRREPAIVEFITPDASRLTPRAYLKPSRRFSLSYAKRLLLGQTKCASSQSASIITLICSRADSSGRLAGQVRAILTATEVNFTLLPEEEDDFGCISCVVASPDTLRTMNLLHDRLCLLFDE